MVSSGNLILFADADGATRFSDLDILLERLDQVSINGMAVVIGSRAHMVTSESVVQVNFFIFFIITLKLKYICRDHLYEIFS